MSFDRPTANHQVTQTVKKSVFIGQLSIVQSTLQADEFIQQVKRLHPKANHNCHCYIAGSPESSSLWAYSDDGEPKGCAGLPMFQVLKHSGLGNIAVVVTRYFGGIKLGTGGMARAYSSTVNLLINAISTEIVHQTSTLTIIAPFHLTGSIEHIVAQLAGTIITQRHWLAHGQKFTICIDEPSVQPFKDAISPIAHLLDSTALSS